MARILIADDNPVTRMVLIASIEGLGHLANGAVDGTAALARACSVGYDLLLLDLHMPGAGGEAVLARLRADAMAASRQAPAIATSAELAPTTAEALCRSGFADALHKPIPLARLEAAVNRILGAPGPAGSGLPPAPAAITATSSEVPAGVTLLDDPRALSSAGSASNVAALRGLFAMELDGLATELTAAFASGDHPALRDRLHRLRASCGYCGALALDDACAGLQRVLDDRERCAAQLATLLDVAHATRARLHGR